MRLAELPQTPATKILITLLESVYSGGERIINVDEPQGVVFQNGGVDTRGKALAMLAGKKEHTFCVVEAASDILAELKKTGEALKVRQNPRLALSIALLHDIGRPLEIIKFERLNTPGYDHGREGAKYFLRLYFGLYHWQRRKLESARIWFPALFRGINYHNKCSFDGSDEFILFIRDADKLGVLRQYSIDQLRVMDDYLQDSSDLSEGLLDELRETGSVKYSV